MKLFVFDTETHLIAPGLQFPPCVCVSVYEAAPMHIPSNGPLPALEGGRIMLPSAGVAAVRAALLDPNTILVGHNIAFDFGVLCALDGTLVPLVFDAYEAGRVSDTGIREQLIQLALGNFAGESFGNKKMGSFSMQSILQARFGMDISADKNEDGWRLRYAQLDGVPLAEWPEEALAYPVRDVVQTYQMHCAQSSDDYSGVVDASGHVTNESEQAAADWALRLMSAWGIRTNRTKVDALAVKLEENSRSVREALTHPSVGIFRAKNGTKDTKLLAAIVEAAYATAEVAVPLTAGGKTSTAKEVLLAAPAAGQPTVWVSMPDEVTGERIMQHAPVLQALASISADEHNLTTYIEPLRSGADVPITARFKVLVESGRTACGKPINLQNLPKYGGYRECVESRPGTVFIQADYSGIELVALAQHCLLQGWQSQMADALIAGRDLHTSLAAEFLNITYEEAVARRKSKDPQMAIMRQAAKQVNFGFPGGMGAKKFVATVKKQISKADFKAIFGDNHDEAEAKAEQYKQTWLNRWPEMRRFFADVSMKVEAGGGEFTLVQPVSGRLRGACQYSDGCNSYFQGLTADGMKVALFYCSMECYTGYSPFWTRTEHAKPSPLFGSRPVIEVHDEFIFESPEDTAAEACERMCQVMVQGMSLYLTDVPVKVEPSMFRVWSKSADEVRDTNGRLAVWEPK